MKFSGLRTRAITWGIPLDELMFSAFFDNLLHLSIMPWDGVITTQATYLPAARNYIHNLYISNFDTPFLFMLDSDVLPRPETIKLLMAHNLPIVGGWYPMKENGLPTVFDADGENFTPRASQGQGLEKVSGIGAGCVLLRRDLALKLGESPYSMENGGEDLAFCRKVTELGYPITVDWNVSCGHVGAKCVPMQLGDRIMFG
jgi:hypothetical protein